MSSLSDAIDFKILYVAALSSFITLLVSHIVNNYEYIYIQIKEYTGKESDIGSNKTLTSGHAMLKRKDTISVSESSMSLICKDMITKDFYAHDKTEDYFKTDEFLNLIPKDPNWVNRKIKLLIPDADNYSHQLHEIMLDNFSPLLIEPKSNICLPDITKAMNLYNQWRKWPVGEKGWKFRKKTKDNMFVYTHSTPEYELDIVKCDKLFPYSVPVIIGVFFNEDHVRKMDPSIKDLIVKGSPSDTCHIIHILVKCPGFIADRDFLNIGAVYFFKDGSVLIVNAVCNDNTLAPVTKDYIRGEIVLSVYHIRPNYDGNLNESNVTFYSLVDIKGSIPSWILNSAYMETAKAVPNLQNYIRGLYNKKIIHEAGQLWIPIAKAGELWIPPHMATPIENDGYSG
eukprot:329736_1